MVGDTRGGLDDGFDEKSRGHGAVCGILGDVVVSRGVDLCGFREGSGAEDGGGGEEGVQETHLDLNCTGGGRKEMSVRWLGSVVDSSLVVEVVEARQDCLARARAWF